MGLQTRPRLERFVFLNRRLLAQRGEPIRDLQALAGHATASFTLQRPTLHPPLRLLGEAHRRRDG